MLFPSYYYNITFSTLTKNKESVAAQITLQVQTKDIEFLLYTHSTLVVE